MSNIATNMLGWAIPFMIISGIVGAASGSPHAFDIGMSGGVVGLLCGIAFTYWEGREK